MNPIQNQYTTLSEIAAQHGITYHALFMRLKNRSIPYVKIGHHTLIDKKDVEALVCKPERAQ